MSITLAIIFGAIFAVVCEFCLCLTLYITSLVTTMSVIT